MASGDIRLCGKALDRKSVRQTVDEAKAALSRFRFISAIFRLTFADICRVCPDLKHHQLRYEPNCVNDMDLHWLRLRCYVSRESDLEYFFSLSTDSSMYHDTFESDPKNQNETPRTSTKRKHKKKRLMR